MAAMSAQQAYNEIKAQIDKQGGPYHSWYCGITSDVAGRLHESHQVPKEGHWYVWRRCFSSKDARDVEAALISLGCDGGPGGGDDSAVYVYAYLKTSTTNP